MYTGERVKLLDLFPESVVRGGKFSFDYRLVTNFLGSGNITTSKLLNNLSLK